MSTSCFNSRFLELVNELARPTAVVPFEGTESRLLRPRMNLHEDAEGKLVTATFELPGLAKDKVNVEVRNGRLTVSGEATESSERDQDGYMVQERRSGKFFRTLQLPEGTQPSAVKAALENGVLTVTFPNSSPVQEAQQIAIN